MWKIVKYLLDNVIINIGAISLFIGILIFFYYKVMRKRNNFNINKKTLKQYKEDDLNNVIVSVFHSKKLYDTLKTKCHPDKFTDEKKREIATELFQSLTEKKHDYKTLKAIEERAITELKI